MFQDLNHQRALGSKGLLLWLWAHVPLQAAAMLLLGRPWLGLSLAAAACAAVATAACKGGRNGPAARATVGVALMCAISLLLAGFKGHEWQLDLHMYYFAALALLAVYCDWVVILCAAATVAVHHLVLDFALPAMIYPGGGDFARVVLHAVVLVVEAATLMWLSYSTQSMFAVQDQARAAELALRDLELKRTSEAADQQRQWQAERMQAAEDQAASGQARVVSGLAEGLGQLSRGNLAFQIGHPFPAEYETLRADFNTASATLRDAMAEVCSNAAAIRGDAGAMSSASDDLSRRTEQQAASLVQTTAALGQIIATVRKTADNAAQARAVVAAATADAAASGAVVQEAVDAMGSIDSSARQISQIIGVVDEIAFQTNLLALNAGVEAARAGDAGRGFAVVASEVRSLAQRSAGAAKEIKTLISTSTRHVDAGVALVGETGKALQRIASQVVEINSVVNAIAGSAQEQADGLQQVTASVSQMDQVTQQNAAMVVDSAAASQKLAQETEALVHLVARFGVDGQPAAPLRAAAGARRRHAG